MALSVSPNGGNGLSNLLRQARPEKLGGKAATASEPATTAVSMRPLGRLGIDSTGTGTAQISAALTVYLSKLGGTEESGAAMSSTVSLASSGGSVSRSGAAELLRVLDAYGSAFQGFNA